MKPTHDRDTRRTTTAALTIQLTKRDDGGAVLRCVRADGSATWQRHAGRQATFFPLHDLTHYTVESELGFGNAFYGLIAQGWTIEDTGGKGARGALPAEAIHVEQLVGALDLERAGMAEWTAPSLNEEAAKFAALRGLPAPRPLDDDQLGRVRSRLLDLFARWSALMPGETLELPFDQPLFTR